MKIFDWNKITEEQKKYLKNRKLILGPKNLSKQRILEITKEKVIFGCLKDKLIEGLQGENFKTLSLNKLQKYSSREDIKILEYFQKDVVYIIKELKPSEVVFVNGSWKGPIHYRPEYWACIDMQIPTQIVAAVSKKDKFDNDKDFQIDINKFYKEEDLIDLSEKVSHTSRCWQAQAGAVIARNGRVLAYAHNTVLPHEHYCLEHDCIREKLHLNPGQDTQICAANHAESEAIDYCAKNGINISGSTMYLSLAPCPVCAKLISRSGIKKVISKREYKQNDMGERILKDSNIIFEIVN